MRRPALTLMETLISIVIVAVGLLGVLSLLPVAARLANNGTVADRGAAAGKNAVADFTVREMHKRSHWVIGNTATAFSPAANQSFCIDPPFVSRFGDSTFPTAAGTTSMRRINLRREKWPPDVDTPLNYSLDDPTTHPPTLPPPAPIGMNQAMADFVFTAHDDLIFDNNPDTTQPPIQQMATAGARQTGGGFSWMATISPRLDGGVPADDKKHTLSIIVFHNRDFGASAEHVANVATPQDFYSAGTGGGDMRVTGATFDDVDHIRKSSWVMLSATAGVTLHRWYRVVDVAGDVDTSGASPAREITLDGPDWPFNAGPNSWKTPQVTVVDGVVAVYERTIAMKQ